MTDVKSLIGSVWKLKPPSPLPITALYISGLGVELIEKSNK
jgi:hypothetical protein